jgi:hypothetical protein
MVNCVLGDESTDGQGAEPLANDIFEREYLERVRKGGQVDFEEIVARHPRRAEGLRFLMSFHRNASKAVDGDTGLEEIIGGRYRVLRKLGSGSFGQVFLAQTLDQTERLVAVKVLRPGLESPEFLARFELECRALARLKHQGTRPSTAPTRCPTGGPSAPWSTSRGCR